jgi:hypothetical protein
LGLQTVFGAIVLFETKQELRQVTLLDATGALCIRKRPASQALRQLAATPNKPAIQYPVS